MAPRRRIPSGPHFTSQASFPTMSGDFDPSDAHFAHLLGRSIFECHELLELR